MQSTDTQAFFNRVPWCSRLLAQPNLRTHAPSSRTSKPATSEDSLFAGTFRTNRTIPSVLVFYPRPAASDSHINAISALFALGDGMNGHPSILHGGIVATILDEAMGFWLNVNSERAHMLAVSTGHKAGELADGTGAFTAQLNIKYLKPVKAPGLLLAKVRLVKVEGRKIWLRGVITQKSGQVDELDGHMIECAVGEALFVEPRTGKL